MGIVIPFPRTQQSPQLVRIRAMEFAMEWARFTRSKKVTWALWEVLELADLFEEKLLTGEISDDYFED